MSLASWKQRERERERAMTAELEGAFDDGEDRPRGPRLGGSGDMVSTVLHVSGAQTRHRNQLQNDENTEVI